ncbi:hypothetical protein [Xanthomonas sacchari]|nr:hypothetical protein [Xanthomonas sacchari]
MEIAVRGIIFDFKIFQQLIARNHGLKGLQEHCHNGNSIVPAEHPMGFI